MIICNAIGGVEKSVRISCKKCRCSSNIFVTGRLAFPLKAGKDYVSLDEAKEKAIASWEKRTGKILVEPEKEIMEIAKELQANPLLYQVMQNAANARTKRTIQQATNFLKEQAKQKQQ